MTAADTVRPYTFEELVRDASFIGVVECEIAGIEVARYRVVEGWKGLAPGSRATIRMLTGNRWDPELEFRIALVGERWVVAAFPPVRLGRFAWHYENPLWWRHLPADLEAGRENARVHPPSPDSRSLRWFHGQHECLDELRRAVLELLELPADRLEARVLRAVARQTAEIQGLEFPDALANQDASIEDMVRAVVRLMPKDEHPALPRSAQQLSQVLVRRGDATTLMVLDRSRTGSHERSPSTISTRPICSAPGSGGGAAGIAPQT